MGSIRRIGKNWQIDATRHGVRVRQIVGSSKRLATEILRDLEGKLVRGEYGLDHKDTPVETLLTRFRDYAKANIAPKSARRYQDVVDRFNEFLRTRRSMRLCSHVTTGVIEDFRQYRLAGSRPPKTKSMNFEIKALRTIFNYGIKWELTSKNPTDGVKSQKVTDAKPLRFLSREEAMALLESSPQDMRSIILGFLLTGMRRGELEHLVWDDIDFSAGMIRIRHKADWRPKTGERDIPMNSDMKDLLLQLRATRRPEVPYVFTIDGKPAFTSDIRRRLMRIAKRAHVKDMTSIHALRHTFGSLLAKSGVALPIVQRLLGHTDIRTTMIYVHTTGEEHREAVEKLDFVNGAKKD